jgi:hypothetical protein
LDKKSYCTKCFKEYMKFKKAMDRKVKLFEIAYGYAR